MLTARLTLLAVALAAGVGWRLEVEWRGWSGLFWVTYFHWAIPAGAGLFAGWLAWHGRARHRVALAIGSLAIAAAAYNALFWSLLVLYSRWPPPIALAVLALVAGGATVVLYPLAIWALGRRCGAPIGLSPCGWALVLWVAAVPLAIVALDLSHHRGGADFLHALKSGVVIPPLLMALGLPFVWSARGETSDARDAEAPIETPRSHSPG